MAFDDGDEDAPFAGGRPLPPDDRLWRHPSELGGQASLAASSPEPAATVRRGGAHPWGIAVVAGLVGAALSFGIVVAVGGVAERVIEKPVIERVPVRPVAELASSNGPGAVAITKELAPAVARIDASPPAGPVSGSAVVFRTDGWLLTDVHLVTGVDDVTVTLHDGRVLQGEVRGRDGASGIAVVKVDADQLPVAMLGSATGLEVGQSTMTIGASAPSAGTDPVISVGTVTAVGRRVSGADGSALRDLVQASASGSAGGPGEAVCDPTGSVVALTITVAPDASKDGVVYATPVDIAKAAAEDIVAGGTVHHGWLGVEGSDGDQGATITKVVDGSPAETAGLAAGDVVTAVDGSKIASMTALSIALRGHHAGSAITLAVLRSGTEQTMVATLGEAVPS